MFAAAFQTEPMWFDTFLRFSLHSLLICFLSVGVAWPFMKGGGGGEDRQIETAARWKIVIVFGAEASELLTLPKKTLNWVCGKHQLSHQAFNWWDQVGESIAWTLI